MLASKAFNKAGGEGALYGNVGQLGTQVLGVVAVGVYSAVVTYVLLKIINKVIGLRVPVPDEREGLDSTELTLVGGLRKWGRAAGARCLGVTLSR